MGVIQLSFQSEIMCSTTCLTVLLPEVKVAKKHKFKVLWLLHGGNFDRNVWITHTNLSSYISNRNIVVVCPDGFNSDFANHPQFADGYNFETYFMEELIPYVQQWFPVSEFATDNYLAGYSMGAAATWAYGLKYPQVFSKIAPLGSALKDYSYLKGVANLTSSEFKQFVNMHPHRFPAGYGNPDLGIRPKEVNMISKYATVQDFLNSFEHTGDRWKELTVEDKIPQIYLPTDSGEKSYDKIKRFEAENCQTAQIKQVQFDYSDLGINGYTFCDIALKKMLDIFDIDFI